MWNYGAALSLIMLIIIAITTVLQGKDNSEAAAGGAI